MAISTSHASYGAFYNKIGANAPSPSQSKQPGKGKPMFNKAPGVRASHDGTMGRPRLTTPLNGMSQNQGQNGYSQTSPERLNRVSFQPKNNGAQKAQGAAPPFTPTQVKRTVASVERGRMFPSMPGKEHGKVTPTSTSGMYSNTSSTGMSPMRPRTTRVRDGGDSPKGPRPASGHVRVSGFDRPNSTTSRRGVEQPPYGPPTSTKPTPIPTHGVKSVGGMYGGLLGRLAVKENQDDYFVTGLDNSPGDFFAGVADGHGLKGGQVSAFVKSKMREKIRDGATFEPEQLLRKVYKDTQEELKKSGIDCHESGTTAVSVLKKGRDLYIANVGDSRAVLLRDNDVVELSNDHKPERRDEKERILRHNGAVEPIKAMNGRFVGPHRVWVKKQVAGGLAMSRSLGDLNMSRAGVIPDPEIKRETISHKDKFLILGSDGVFEHMDNREVAAIARRYDDPRQASEAIVAEARKKWANQQTGYCDDITALVVKLND